MEAFVEQKTTQTYNTFIPENNAEKYWKTFEVAKQFKNDPLEQQRQTLMTLAGRVAEQITPETISHLQQDLSGDGNVINYLTMLLDAAKSQDPLQLQKAETGVTNNLFTAIAEHPLADAVGEYRYELTWEKNPITGALRLKGEYGYIDDILEQAVSNKSGQIPQFEIERNKINRAFYEQLKKTRSNPTTRNQVLIEFSPSPQNINDAEVKNRGYRGNDTFLVYRLDETGKEQITQYWLPMVDLNHYRTLLQEIGKILPDQKNLNDLQTMEASGVITEKQLQRIMQFIYTRNQNILNHKPEILDFAEQNIRPNISQRILTDMYETGIKLLSNYNQSELMQKLDYIFKQIEWEQFNMRMYIKETAGLDTFTGKTKTIINKHEISYSQLQNLPIHQQINIMNSADYKGSGCGSARKSNGFDLASALRAKGSFNSIVSGGALFNEELFLFVCTECGHEEDIDVPAGIYVKDDRCPGCGKYIGCGPESKAMEKNEELQEDFDTIKQDA